MLKFTDYRYNRYTSLQITGIGRIIRVTETALVKQMLP